MKKIIITIEAIDKNVFVKVGNVTNNKNDNEIEIQGALAVRELINESLQKLDGKSLRKESSK